MHKKLEEAVSLETAGQVHNQGQNSQTYRSLPEAHYHLNYAAIKETHSQAVQSNQIRAEPLFRKDPPSLDLKVRILFEENLNTMVFPKVKELLFRVSRNSPVELAAKALARKNQHPMKWRDYSFSLMKQNEQFTEIRIENLSKSFESMIALSQEGVQQQKAMTQDELILFYRVKDLEQFNFEEKENEISLIEASEA